MIKYWIKKYSYTIIIFLLVVLFMKSCKSCSIERHYNYNVKQIETFNKNIIDSLYDVINYNNLKYDSLQRKNELLLDSLHNITYENNILKTIILEVRNDKEYYKNQNINLVNIANNLYTKDTIK